MRVTPVTISVNIRADIRVIRVIRVIIIINVSISYVSRELSGL